MKCKSISWTIVGLTLLFCAFRLNSETISTLDGKIYNNAVVSEVNPAGIVVSYDEGVAQIPFTSLGDEIRKKYNYDPVKAQEYITQQRKANFAWDAKFIESEKEEKARRNKELEEIEKDLDNYRKERQAAKARSDASQPIQLDQGNDYLYVDSSAPYYVGGWGYYPGNFSYTNPYWWNKFHGRVTWDNGGRKYIPEIHGSNGYRFGSSLSRGGGAVFHGGGGRR